MASGAVQISDGTAITFASGFFAQILGIEFDEIKAVLESTAHFGTAAAGSGKVGNETFIASDIIDPGGINVEMHFNPDTLPPVPGVFEACTVTFKDGATWAASACLESFKPSIPFKGKMRANAKLKFSGEITRTAAP